jgi:hypothetical protein
MTLEFSFICVNEVIEFLWTHMYLQTLITSSIYGFNESVNSIYAKCWWFLIKLELPHCTHNVTKDNEIRRYSNNYIASFTQIKEI